MLAFAVVAFALEITAAGGQEDRRDRVALRDLTVPAVDLPAGCAVPPRDAMTSSGRRVAAGLWAGLPITTNPWIGSDRTVLAEIRVRMEGSPRVPDGPPLTVAERERYRLTLADGIDEGYAAVYQDAESSDLILVYGVRFAAVRTRADSSWRPATPLNPRAVRVALGPIEAAVHGTGQCFEAVTAHVRRLRKD